MKSTSDKYDALKQAVEKVCARKMCTPRDFDFLAMYVADVTGTHVSSTTLKRFWGYLDRDKEHTPRLFTLDLLSTFVGYKDWETYCQQSSENVVMSSDFIKSPSLYAESLTVGNNVKLLWKPDRCVTIRYAGEDKFEVVESLNSKLQAGDRFCCSCFIEGATLCLSRLVRNGEILGGYMCGNDDGIKFVVENRGG